MRGGGILPIATAEIGTEVPEERRGLALGLVGAVFGIANLLYGAVGLGGALCAVSVASTICLMRLAGKIRLS